MSISGVETYVFSGANQKNIDETENSTASNSAVASNWNGKTSGNHSSLDRNMNCTIFRKHSSANNSTMSNPTHHQYTHFNAPDIGVDLSDSESTSIHQTHLSNSRFHDDVACSQSDSENYLSEPSVAFSVNPGVHHRVRLCRSCDPQNNNDNNINKPNNNVINSYQQTFTPTSTSTSPISAQYNNVLVSNMNTTTHCSRYSNDNKTSESAKFSNAAPNQTNQNASIMPNSRATNTILHQNNTLIESKFETNNKHTSTLLHNQPKKKPTTLSIPSITDRRLSITNDDSDYDNNNSQLSQLPYSSILSKRNNQKQYGSSKSLLPTHNERQSPIPVSLRHPGRRSAPIFSKRSFGPPSYRTSTENVSIQDNSLYTSSTNKTHNNIKKKNRKSGVANYENLSGDLKIIKSSQKTDVSFHVANSPNIESSDDSEYSDLDTELHQDHFPEQKDAIEVSPLCTTPAPILRYFTPDLNSGRTVSLFLNSNKRSQSAMDTHDNKVYNTLLRKHDNRSPALLNHLDQLYVQSNIKQKTQNAKNNDKSDEKTPLLSSLPSSPSSSSLSSIKNNTQNIKTAVYKKRWYMLFVFSMFNLIWNAVWTTWGPIAQSAKAAFDWSDGNIAMFTWLGNVPVIIVMFPFAYLMDVKGMKTAMIICTGITMLGAALRCISTDPEAATWLNYGGQLLNGAAGAVAMSAGAVISGLWFPASQRATATGIATMTGYLGACVSFIIECGGAVIIFFLVVIYFPSKPVLPPSKSASLPREDYVDGLKILIRNKQFWCTAIAYGFPIGIYENWQVILDVILNPRVSQETAGWLDFYGTLGGCLAGLLMSRFADYFTRQMKLFLIVFYLIAAGAILWFILLVDGYLPFDTVSLYASVIIISVCLDGSAPLFFELVIEVSYPCGEGVTSGLLQMLVPGVGTVFLSLMQLKTLGKSWVNWCFLGCTMLSIPLLVFIKTDFIRADLDKDNGDGDDDTEESIHGDDQTMLS